MNREEVNEEWVVGSTDIVSLYLSLDVKRCAKVVRNRLYASKMVFRNLQWKEIALYLVYNMGADELTEYGLMEHCPTRRHDKRPPVGVVQTGRRSMNHGYSQRTGHTMISLGRCSAW